jgi:YHS domain-containing protein
MLTRFLLYAVFAFFVWRTIRRFLAGIAQGAASSPPRATRGAGPPAKGELMVRDPVCGTYVLPSRASSTRDTSGTHYFCSDTCRQAYAETARPA